MATDGFVRLPFWFMEHVDLPLHEYVLYIALLRFRNPKTGKCWPGMTTLADVARISVPTVKRTIPKLEARGLVEVKREKVGNRNLPNIYTVKVPDKQQPEHVWESSAKGRRIPKRPRVSQTPPPEVVAGGGVSQIPPGVSQTLGVVSGGPSKKINVKKINEEAVTPTFSESGYASSFSSDIQGEPLATEKQVAYLKDLAIHIGYETGGGIPNDLQLQRWRKLTRAEADRQIYRYKKALGRPDDLYYPQAGDPEYDALSTAGQEFAESAGDPESVFEYGFAMKENTA